MRTPSDASARPPRFRAGSLRPPRRLAAELSRILEVRRPGVVLLDTVRSRRLCRSSWAVEDLQLFLSDGSILELVWKDLERESPGSRAARIKPRRLASPERELRLYQHVLAPAGIGAPYWGSVCDDRHGIHWLFLEPVEGTPLCEVGDPAAWSAAAAWLGSFHARFGRARLPRGLLLRQDAGLHRRWHRRALSFVRPRHRVASSGGGARSRPDSVHPDAELLRRLASLHRRAVREVFAGARVLLHGEFYPANVLVTGSSRRPEAVPVDWEMAGSGPAVLDLAALASGGWGRPETKSMVRAYRDASLGAGVRCPSAERLLRLVDHARLLLAVQWLGWTDCADWKPPEELRTDWFLEAVGAADRLDPGWRRR